MTSADKDRGIPVIAHGDKNPKPSGISHDYPDTLIDINSAISIEEQREIIAQINGIAEKNRRSFSAETKTGSGMGSWKSFKARKNGGLYPVLVNVLAVLILASGFLVLSSFQREADIQAREGARALNPAIRAIIEEIRGRTNALLEAKDREISLLVSLLANIEIQLQEFLAGGGALTVEQLATQSRLNAEREGYRTALALAWEERARILESAHTEEMEIRAWIHDPVAGNEPDSARMELAILSGEQRQATAVEAQVTGLFAIAHRHIEESNFNEAEQTLTLLREFLDTPVFQYRRAIQTRRDLYTRTIEVLETLLYDNPIAHANIPTSELSDNIESLHEEIHRLTRERDDAMALVATGSGAEPQYRDTVTTLRQEAAARQAEHEAAISALRTQNADMQRQLDLAWQQIEQFLGEL